MDRAHALQAALGSGIVGRRSYRPFIVNVVKPFVELPDKLMAPAGTLKTLTFAFAASVTVLW